MCLPSPGRYQILSHVHFCALHVHCACMWNVVPEIILFYFLFSGYAGFDVADLSEDAPDDIEGLDASAAHVANLLSTEPADSMIPELFSVICC